jgi:hypothetical protein
VHTVHAFKDEIDRRGVCYDVIVIDKVLDDKRGRSRAFADAGVFIADFIIEKSLVEKGTVVVVHTAFPTVWDCFAVVRAGGYYVPKVLRDKATKTALPGECKRFIEDNRFRKELPERLWVWYFSHCQQLQKQFPGKAFAIVDSELAEANGLEEGTNIFGQRVVVASSTAEIRTMLRKNQVLRNCLPLTVGEINEE